MILEAFEQSLNETGKFMQGLERIDYWMINNPDYGLPLFLGMIFIMNYVTTEQNDSFKERTKTALGITIILSFFLVPLFLGAALVMKNG